MVALLVHFAYDPYFRLLLTSSFRWLILYCIWCVVFSLYFDSLVRCITYKKKPPVSVRYSHKAVAQLNDVIKSI